MEVEGSAPLALVQAVELLLRLRVLTSSPLPRKVCAKCQDLVEQALVLHRRVERGQAALQEMLRQEQGQETRRGRGRPRKGEEKIKEVGCKLEESAVGRRKITVPKRFEQTVHELKPSEEEKLDDMEENRLNIDEGEEVTVTIDLSNSKPSENPVVDEINSILNQFDQSEKEVGGSAVSYEIISCEVCDKTFTGVKQLHLHTSTSHGQIMYKCELDSCNALLKSKIELSNHQTASGHKDFIILEIGNPQDSLLARKPIAKDTIVQNLLSQSVEVEKTKVYSCPEEGCNRHFPAPSSLTYHKFSVHNKQTYSCTHEGCEKTFKIRNLLTRHLRTHTSDRTFACDQCDKSFKTHSNLASHKTVHTEESKFFCDECGQQFKHRTSLVSHMRWHQGSKPHKCPYCQKSFNQNGNLQEHIRIHTGERPYKCEMCPREFTTSSQHKLHIKRHLGLKQFKCEFCSKSFLNKDTFKTHIRRHKGEKPYGCKLCKKSFAESWALTKHMRFHSGVQPYLCKECGKKFSDSSNLAKHKKIHESGGGSKAVWSMVREGVEEQEEGQGEEVQQVIYIAYEDGEQKTIEGAIKDGQLDLAALAAQGISVEEEVVEEKESPDQDEQVQKTPPTTESQTIDLTTKDGRGIRLVAPLAMDPLAFAAEYLKDMSG